MINSSISFCIATAKNEKEYVLLLLRSLRDNTDITKHEIVIFIDSDNQNTYEALLQEQQNMPNIKICKNPYDHPIGSQRNVSVLFNAAKNDIVCYLQSDMVVGKDIDKYISENMISEDIVLTCARIEPPLHPPGSEKIIIDLGVTPEEFQYDKFNSFVSNLQAENRPNIEGNFAPFALYKKSWLDKLGGFDTQFRSSREDDDMAIRMNLSGFKMIQSWNACVYHFTCVSSRGINWFKSNPEEREVVQQLQQLADAEEYKKFIRKWGKITRVATPVYDIAIFIDVDRYMTTADFEFLGKIELFCKRLYLNKKDVAEEVYRRSHFYNKHYNNLRWNYTEEYWDSVKEFFNPEALDGHIQFLTNPKDATNDILINCKFSELIKSMDEKRITFLENINQVIYDNEIGQYIFTPFTIDVNRKLDLSQSYIKINNTALLLGDNTLEFK